MSSQPTLGPIIGSQVGNYRVLRELGSGAMGEVFLAEHPQIGSKVAIKALAPHLSANPEMGNRFMSEARAANRINHPNIIQIFDFGRLEDGRLYLVMEFLTGRELTAHLKKNAPLPIGEVSELLRQITSAMGAAHEAGIIHRDLKPDNIFLHEAGGERIVKILDFGIAKLTQGDLGAGHMTATGVVMGTPLYMSPEQAAGRVDEISPQSDIYAIGVILYQMLSGALPIAGPTAAQILAGHIAEPPIPLDRVVTGLPPALLAVVNRCLEKRPADRYASTADLYRAFGEAVAGLPTDLRGQPTLANNATTGTVAYGSQPTGLLDRSEGAASEPPTVAARPAGSGTGAEADAATVAARPAGSGTGPGGDGATVAARPQRPEEPPTVLETPGSRTGPGADGQPTTLRSASGQSLAMPMPTPAGGGRKKLVVGIGAGLALMGIGAVLVLRFAGGEPHAKKPAEAAAAGPMAAEPVRRPRPEQTRPVAPMPPPPRLVAVQVTCRTRGAEISVQQGDGPAELRRAPFSVKVPAGTRLKLTARKRGFAPREQTLVVDKDTALDLTLTRRVRRRWRPRRRWTPPPRPRRRRGGRRPVGEGTLRLD